MTYLRLANILEPPAATSQFKRESIHSTASDSEHFGALLIQAKETTCPEVRIHQSVDPEESRHKFPKSQHRRAMQS